MDYNIAIHYLLMEKKDDKFLEERKREFLILYKGLSGDVLLNGNQPPGITMTPRSVKK